MATKRTTANKKRTTGSKKQTSRKKTAASRKNNREKLEDYQDYQVSFMIAALAIIFFIGCILYITYFGFGKTFGIFVSGISFGIFGWFAWILPVFVFVAAAFYLANGGSRQVTAKILSAALFFLFLESFLQLFLHGRVLTDYYKEGKNIVLHASTAASNPVIEMFRLARDEGRGGCGMIAYGITAGLTKCFGQFISAVILLVAMFLTFWALFGKKILAAIRERNAYYDEMKSIYEEESSREDYVEPSYRLRRKTEEKRVMTFNLKQMEDLAEPDSGKNKKTPKKRGRKKGTDGKSIDMEEILPDTQRKPSPRLEKRAEESVCEEELWNKFGSMEKEEPAEEDVAEGSILFMEGISQETDVPERPEADVMEEMEDIMPPQKVYGEEAKKPDKRPSGATAGSREKAPQSNSAKSMTPAESVNAALAQAEADKKAREEKRAGDYVFPSVDLLKKGKNTGKSSDADELAVTAQKLRTTLESFGVRVRMGNATCGPTVTRFELLPEQGVKVSKITSLADDIKLSLAAPNIRIEAPIPGKSAVGIEVPNAKKSPVSFRDLVDNQSFFSYKSDVAFAVGKDIAGKNIITDIAKMPHLLIAGATGSGKSVCINTLIMSILYKAHPNDVKLIMIDPKVVELSVYNGIPHLFIPVVTDPKKASAALNWAVMEMMERYNKFADLGVRNVKGYNEKLEKEPNLASDEGYVKMPQIVIIVDELADLMMVASKEVEDAICRLAQLARAAGIHLIIATQRPSVNVITGTIKANIPSRIAFSVSSAIDSRTILDSGGAEKLLGQGDMLFFPSGYSEPVRLQGAFVSDEEVNAVVDFLKQQNLEPAYNEEITNHVTSVQAGDGTQGAEPPNGDSGRDEYFADAGRFIIESGKASVGMLQRRFSVGFNRAARIMDQLSDVGVVGPAEGTKPRQIILTLEEFEELLANL